MIDFVYLCITLQTRKGFDEIESLVCKLSPSHRNVSLLLYVLPISCKLCGEDVKLLSQPVEPRPSSIRVSQSRAG